MTEPKEVSSRLLPRPPSILFAPLTWLKLQYFCHAGDTEISGFAVTAKDDPLYVEDFVTVRQHTSFMTVALDDQAVTRNPAHRTAERSPLSFELRVSRRPSSRR